MTLYLNAGVSVTTRIPLVKIYQCIDAFIKEVFIVLFSLIFFLCLCICVLVCHCPFEHKRSYACNWLNIQLFVFSDLSYNFDIIVEPGLMCGDIEGISEVSVFRLATTKLSVALWARFTTTSRKVIMSLYATE